MSKEEYLDFMYNKENSHNCKSCPENIGCDNWQSRKPCGQWHCWVNIFVAEKEGRSLDY